MYTKIGLMTSCLIAIMLSACISLSEYTDQESELKASQIQKDEAESRLKQVENRLHQAEDRIQKMDADLQLCKTLRTRTSNELKKLGSQHNYLKKLNRQLSKNINMLQQELSKKKSVIHLQEKVIQLLDDTKKTIETSLKDQIAAKEIEVVGVDDKLKVIFVDKILFDSGSVEINPRGKELLLTMAGSLKDNDNHNIVVEGHTDNVPLNAELKKRFPSNWELSTARAAAVVRFFQQNAGIQPQRLSARGYSFYRSLTSNNTQEGRRQNRRIEIILGPSN
ncbi:MAG: OmpA family protein [Deltaproteobacteria bacterium]|nr:OmpA family protein [Deltaproteobacteria bacterium]